MRNDVEVVCLPRHLPEYLDLDISKLELDGMMYLTDIPLPEGVSIPEIAIEEEAGQAQPVVSIHVIKEEIIEEEVEEEGVEAAAEAEVPTVGEDEAAAESDDDGEKPED
jgi:large subunit ribosomal protein L25